MPIIENCEFWYPKLDPKRPNNKGVYNQGKPKWEIEIRTKDKKIVKRWKEQNLKVKSIIPEEGEPYFKVNLRKNVTKVDGTDALPVEVVDGNKQPVKENTIGNGSLGNVRVYQYPYPTDDAGSQGIASILMGVQLTKHIVYNFIPTDDFNKCETERITPEDGEMTEQNLNDNGDEIPDEDEIY